MQEDIERRTIAIIVKAPRLTARVLAVVLGAVAHEIQKGIEQSKTPQGRQSVAKLMNHHGTKNSMPLDGDTRLFDRVAKKCGVDYAFYPTGPGKHLLFFKAGQVDAITACFAEYTKRVAALEKGRPSITKQLERFGEMAQSRPRERERTREAVRDEHTR